MSQPHDTPAAKCTIRVVIRDEKEPDVLIHDKEGDHNDRYFRDWITKTVWWALRNGKGVSMYPLA